MNDFIIVTDSTTDLPHELTVKHNIIVLPLKYNIEGKEYVNYLDYREQKVEDFYDLVKKGSKPTTSQTTPGEYVKELSKYLDEGKDILILSFSSALSGTYNSSRLASIELSEKYPNNKIYAIDTKSASLGEGLLVYLASLYKEKGKTIDEVKDFVLEKIPHIGHWFTVDDINHLRRGGRISAVSSLVAKALSIKPVMHTNIEGKLIPRNKAISRKKAIKALALKMEELAEDNQKYVFIGHGNDLVAANQLKELVLEKYKDVEITINNIGPVIGSHTGQGVLALFFVAKER